VPFDKSSWGTPEELHQRKFAKAANGETCGSYLPDGRWNLGGWWTYPSKEAKALSSNPGLRTAPGPRNGPNQ
jgi:hypothetical protein